MRWLGLFLLVSSAAFAQPSTESAFNHKGSLGLTAAVGGEVFTAVAPSVATDQGPQAMVDVGGTLAFSQGWAAVLEGRFSFGRPTLGLSFMGGLRSSSGERLKTFVDLTVIVHLVPRVTAGPRVGFGLQYELSEFVGVYALAAAHISGGAGLRIGGELLIGAQFRTYVFD